MKKINKFLRLLLVSLCGFVLIAADGAQVGMTVQTVNMDNYPTIEVTFSAWDASGLPLKDLKKEDFVIEEVGGGKITPNTLTFAEDASVSVALVLDISSSMKGQPLTDMKSAAARFLDRLGELDQAALVAFSSDVDVQPSVFKSGREIRFTSDFGVIYDAVEDIQAEGGTEIYNALQKAVSMTAKLPQQHRAVLLMSDGRNDPANVGDPEMALSLAKQEGIPVFVIGLGNLIDQNYLTRLAEETGGFAWFTPRSAELAEVFADIAGILKTQYTLTFNSQIEQPMFPYQAKINLQSANQTATYEFSVDQIPEAPSTPPSLTSEHTLTPTLLPSTTDEIPAEGLGIVAAEETSTLVYTPESDQAVQAPLTWMTRNLTWFILGLLGLLAVIVFSLVNHKRKLAAAVSCAKCGYKLDANMSTCPQCGETRKLPTLPN